MTQQVRRIPDGYHAVTPYVIVKGAAKFVAFMETAFGATDRGQVPNDDGTIGHAEVQIADSIIMTFDAKPDWPATPGFLTLYVDDCDAVHQAALDAGATTVTPLSTNAWGDRGSRIRDPFGNIWWIQTHVEDVPEAEIMSRMGDEVFVADAVVSTETLDREIRRIGRQP
ncbi:VOC family protein [Pseudonocardia sp. TRM90224]|uniref:VOC family protein n=1 Tax=Pseudonocardia sp. TRM90224 TaxID=2812678 RepID=UPI001E603147|nr:VOC family protein [Pseudonocardia sp. TRM90224]